MNKPKRFKVEIEVDNSDCELAFFNSEEPGQPMDTHYMLIVVAQILTDIASTLSKDTMK